MARRVYRDSNTPKKKRPPANDAKQEVKKKKPISFNEAGKPKPPLKKELEATQFLAPPEKIKNLAT